MTFRVKLYDSEVHMPTRWGIWDERNGEWVELRGIYASPDYNGVEKQLKGMTEKEEAVSLGKEQGTNAAEWAIDPARLSKEQMKAILKGIRECDLAVMDQFREPSLSGEFAEDMTLIKLCLELGISPTEGDDEYQAHLAEVWEGAAQASFWAKIEQILTQHTEGE